MARNWIWLQIQAEIQSAEWLNQTQLWAYFDRVLIADVIVTRCFYWPQITDLWPKLAKISPKMPNLTFGNHPFHDKITSPVILKKRKAKKRTKVTTKKFRNLDLIQLHLKVQKNLESKKVTEKGEYYFAKGFKVLLSCATKNRSRLMCNVKCIQSVKWSTRKSKITKLRYIKLVIWIVLLVF